jgi:hypothetical protein
MKVLASATVAAALLAGPAWGACTYPTKPDRIPDGNTATMEQMLEAKKQVDQYNKDMTAYLDCIKLEHDSAMPPPADTASDDEKKAYESKKKDADARHTQKHNAAIDELEGVAGSFNEQVKVFRAKNPK